ncbi:hypothetical protein CJF30_00010356 [Rutstroemia sp. NJR-2017a BBW]|nr:hypothetical protein CJF30_00010356 [Rutstroemia sp. NJR-2017a BBW]
MAASKTLTFLWILLLWIDAICIDQRNLTERADQVRIMDRIFGGAFGVTVYLGEATTGSNILFEELAEADKLLSQGESCDRPSPSDSIIRELDALFRRAWFERVWVLQEVYMKDSIKLMCGSASASSAALSALCYGYRNTRVTTNTLPLVLYLVRHSLDEFSTPQFSLWNLLYKSRACLATDPRDKIFALKSLIDLQQQSEMDYLIDYSGTFDETLIKTAMFLLPVLGLRILTAVRHPHERDIPSWIPDWSQNLPLLYPHFDIEFYNPNPAQAAPKLKPLTEQTNKLYSIANGKNSRTQLLATGCRYAQIIGRSQVFSFLDVEDAKAQMERLYYSLGNLRQLVNLEDIKDGYNIYGQLEQEIADSRYIENICCDWS